MRHVGGCGTRATARSGASVTGPSLARFRRLARGAAPACPSLAARAVRGEGTDRADAPGLFSFFGAGQGARVATADDPKSEPSPRDEARKEFTRECIAINGRILAATDPEDILDLVVLRGESFSYVNAVTAFYHVAKLCDRQPAYRVQRIKTDPRLAACCDLVLARISDLDTQALANAWYAHALVGHGTAELVQGLLRAAEDRRDRLTKPAELGIVMWSVARSQTNGSLSPESSRAFLTNLWPTVASRISTLDPQAIFNVTWAYVATGADASTKDALPALCRAAERCARRFTFREAAGMLLALSKARCFDDGAFQALSASALSTLTRARQGSLPMKLRPRDADFANIASAIGHYHLAKAGKAGSIFGPLQGGQRGGGKGAGKGGNGGVSEGGGKGGGAVGGGVSSGGVGEAGEGGGVVGAGSKGGVEGAGVVGGSGDGGMGVGVGMGDEGEGGCVEWGRGGDGPWPRVGSLPGGMGQLLSQMMAYLTDDPWDTEIDTGVSQGAVSGKGGRQSGGGSGEGSEDEGRSEMGSAGRAMRGSEATGSGRVRGGNVGAGAGASASAGAGGRGRGERGVGGNGREGSYVSRSRSPMGRDGSPSKRPRSPVSFDQSRSSSFENGVGVGMGWEDPLGGVALDLNDAAPWEKRGEGTAPRPARRPPRPSRTPLSLMRPRYLSNVLWALAVTDTYDGRFLNKAAGALLARVRAGSTFQFPPQTVGMVAWSYARLGHAHPALLEACAGLTESALKSTGFKTDASGGPNAREGMGTAPPNKLTSSSLFMDPDAQPVNQRVAGMVAAALAALAPESEVSRNLLRRLAAAMAQHWPALGGQAACNVLWALACCGVYPPEMAKIKQRAAQLVGSMNASELWQLYQVDLATKLEAPHLKPSAPEDFSSAMAAMFEDGRMKDRAARSWEVGKTCEMRSVSRFQLDVLRAIRQLGYPPSIATLEHSCEYTIDIAMPHCMVAIEVDGPLHFYRNRRELQGRSLLKHRLLRALGWTVVSVPYWEWNANVPWERRVRILREKLEKAGVPPPPQPSPPQSQTAGGSGSAGNEGEGVDESGGDGVGGDGAAMVEGGSGDGESEGRGEGRGIVEATTTSSNGVIERAARLSSIRGKGKGKGEVLLRAAVRRGMQGRGEGGGKKGGAAEGEESA